MSKLILDDISGTPNFYVKVNENSRRIEAAIEEALLRTGAGPNFMSADLDMNGHNILNQRNVVALDTFNWRGDWVTETLYMTGDTVFIGGASYINLVEHTSDVFLDDFNLGYWDVVVQAVGVLPDQTGEDGKFLQTNGVTTEWVDVTTVADAVGTASTLVSNLDATLHSVAKSGNYSELNNKPTIPAAQVNSDWNAASGVAQILNKPTIPAAQVNSDWNAASGVAQILNKPSLDFVDRVNPQTIAGVKTFTSRIAPSSTQGILGTTTNDNAISGSIGEVISAQILEAGRVNLTNGAVTTLMQITLTPGHWFVYGQGAISANAAGAALNRFGFSFSTTTNVLDANNLWYNATISFTSGSAGTYLQASHIAMPYKISSPITIYMVFVAGFTSGGYSAYGSIAATRVR